MYSERVEREKKAHDDDDVLGASERIKSRFPHIYKYPSRQRIEALIDSIVADLRGKKVLDYGCGRGLASISYLKNGAHVTGIDISKVYITEASSNALENGFTPDQFDFKVMDAHRLEFADESFDLVIGRGILHHLEPDVALDEIHRVLKKDGRVVLLEPLADNLLLKLFRILTPGARTKDEAPFSGSDLRRLIDERKWKSEVKFCGLLQAPLAMITSHLLPKKPDNIVLRIADKVESALHRSSVLDSHNQYVLINLIRSDSSSQRD